jgi:hypothetical protein
MSMKMEQTNPFYALVNPESTNVNPVKDFANPESNLMNIESNFVNQLAVNANLETTCASFIFDFSLAITGMGMAKRAKRI